MKSLSSIYVSLLTEEERQKIAKSEVAFLKDAIDARQKILSRIKELSRTCKSVKDLAKALEIINSEIKVAYKNLSKLTSSQPQPSEELEEIEEMERKLNELSRI